MKKIRIHPSTLVVFLLLLFLKRGREYFILYIFIFLHELTHMACALFLKEKHSSIHLYPFGCILFLSNIPSRRKNLAILLSGPLFNLAMFFLGIFPKENLSLFAFNMIPVMPLDGGGILNIILPKYSFILSFIFICILFILCFCMDIFPLIPLLLLLVLLFSRKICSKKLIDIKVMDHLAKNKVENTLKKLYNIKIEK